MIEISLDSPVPLGDQLVAGIRHLIAAGTLRPGDELPPVRQLAADLGINLNTVARAYRELEAAGLAVAARGRGTRVTSSREGGWEPGAASADGSTRPPQAPAPTIAATVALNDTVSRMLTDAKLSGFTSNEVRSCVDRLISHYWPQDTGPTK